MVHISRGKELFFSGLIGPLMTIKSMTQCPEVEEENGYSG